MKYCNNCGNQVKETDKFCSNCGSKLFQDEKLEVRYNLVKLKICDVCGEENSNDSDECSYCGVGFTGKEKIIEKKISITQSENFEKSKSPIEKQIQSKIQTKKKKKDKEKKVNLSESKKISTKYFIISGLFILIFLIVLIYSGYDSSKSSFDKLQTQDQEIKSGIDLKALNEINQLENELKNDPENQQKLLRLANLTHDSGFFEKAISYYQKYLQLNPGDNDAEVDMGVCYFELEQYDKARNTFESVIQKNPNHQIAHLNLGIVNLTTGEIEKAKELFKKCIELGEHTDAGHKAAELLKSH